MTDDRTAATQGGAAGAGDRGREAAGSVYDVAVLQKALDLLELITEAGDLESARRHIALTGGAQGLHGTDPFKLILVDLELRGGRSGPFQHHLREVTGSVRRHPMLLKRGRKFLCKILAPAKLRGQRLRLIQSIEGQIGRAHV